MLGTSIEINNKSFLVLALQRIELNSQKHLSFAVKLKETKTCGNKLLTTPGYAKLYLAEKDV